MAAKNAKTAMMPPERCVSAPRIAVVVAGLAIALATAAAFSNSFHGPLVFDDGPSIVDNPTIRQLWPPWETLCPPKRGETVTGRPLLNLSLAVNYSIGGTTVWSYHVTNLAIHIATALLLFGLVRRTLLLPGTPASLAKASNLLAASIALLWSVHPLQTESVTYIVQRAESLAGLFYLSTLYGLLRGATAQRRTGLWYAISFVACLLGMASKEIVASAPLIALLYDRTFLAGSFREALHRRRRLYVSLGATWLLLLWLVVDNKGRGGTAGFGQEIEPLAYLGTQFGAVIHYLRLCIWPSPLVLDYGVEVAHTAAEIVPYGIVIAALVALTVAALRRWPKIGFLGVFFFALLAPTSTVIPVTTQTVAEHRMYLPLAAVVTLIAMGAWTWCNRRRITPTPTTGVAFACVVATAAVALGAATYQRNKVYQSNLQIWTDTVAKVPDNARALTNLGATLLNAHRPNDAISHLQRAASIQPDNADGQNKLGSALLMCGRPAEAIPHFQVALQRDPANAEVRNNFGSALTAQGRYEEASDQFRKALDARGNYVDAMNNLAWLLATCPQHSLHNGPEALALAQRAERLTGGRRPEVLDTLAAAYATSERFQEAAATARKALELATKQNQQALVDALQQRIALYDSGKPFVGNGQDAAGN
ncbi:MAG: tetratricopeptide repeat protein [Thermoguttaceae bacterium]